MMKYSVRCRIGRLSAGLLMLALLTAIPSTAQIIAAPDAPTHQRPVILETANGLPQIELTAPTTAGVSRNSFAQFDVDSHGAILNNGRKASLTELGGWIAANPNMAAGSARIILNEVQSSDPSQLRGYLEIAGGKAELVIANPVGITCRGCGFIQASRVQLVTGTPEFQGTGITGFSTGPGSLRIEAQGLDGRRVDAVTLLSQAVNINAGLWANDLSIRLARPAGDDTPHAAPVFALDVAALGGMYAGKIWLIGASHGLGVRNAGVISAQSGLTLSTDGQLENIGRLDATQLVLKARTIDNLGTGSITGQDVAIDTGRLSNAGHPEATPLIAAEHQLHIGADEIINTDRALIFSAGDLRIGGVLNDQHQTNAASTLLTNTNATIEALGDLDIQADQLYNLNAGVSTEERQVGTTSTRSYLQPQGSSTKSPLSNFRWESWSRAGRYRLITDSDQLTDGILGQTPMPGVSEELCDGLTEAETCTPLRGAQYLRDDPAWDYFKLTPPDEAPPAPGNAPTLPVVLLPPEPADNVDPQSAAYLSWLAQKTTYDEAWSEYHAAKNRFDERVNTLNAWTVTTASRRDALDEAIQEYNRGFSSAYITAWTQYLHLQRSEFETVVTESHPGQIIAGGDITLTGRTLVNDRSRLIAGGELRGSLDQLANIDTTGTHRIRESGTSQHTQSRWRGGFRRYHQRDWGPVLPYLPADVITTKSLGLYQTSENSTTVATHSLQAQAEDVLETNQSLTSVNPNSGPLLVTDPRFTQYRQWLSSDAMLNQLGHAPEMMQKRIGDGFIEQRLIREQLAELTGRRLLPGYATDEAQYAALMASGAHHAERLALRPGIALTAQQMATLTSDLVWLVEQDITIPGKHGQPSRTERVLVPKVYLLPREGDLQADGTLISGERVALLVSDSLQNSASIIGHDHLRLHTGTLENDGGTLSGGQVAIHADADIHHRGGSIRSKGDLALVAGRDVTLQSTTQRSTRSDLNRNSVSTASRTHIDRPASVYVSGTGDLVVHAGRDLTLSAAQVRHEGKGSTRLVAKRDLDLQTVDTASHTASHSRRNSANFLRETSSREIGSQIIAQRDIALEAGRDLRARAAEISHDEGQIAIVAGRDVQLDAGESRNEFAQGSQYKSGSLTGSRTRTQVFEADRSDTLQTVISGDRVRILAGDDIQVNGATVVSDQDTRLSAGKDISLSASTNTARVLEHDQLRKSGVFSGPGVSITVGKQQTDNTQEINSTTRQASMIGSLRGDVGIVAAGDYRQEASQVLALSGSVEVDAQNVHVIAGTDTHQAANHSTFRQSGVTVTVSNPVISAAQTLDQLQQARNQTSDERAQRIAAASAALTVADTVSMMRNDPGKTAGVTVSVMVGSSRSESRSEQHTRLASPSMIAGAADVSLSARDQDDAALRIIGSQLTAGRRVRMYSDGEIDLAAHANTTTQTSQSTSSSNAIGIAATIDKNKVGLGVALATNRGNGNADGEDLHWTPTQIQAGAQAELTAANDLRLRGAIVAAEQVTARTGRNLHVESLQDSSRYTSAQRQLSANVVIPITGMPSAQVGGGHQHVTSTYQSVADTSGIRAGDDGFVVEVAEHTTIKGAVITSTEAAHREQKNQFNTGTLETRDLHNHASFSASATELTAGANQQISGNFTPSNTSAGHASDRGSSDSLTRAAITGIAGNTSARTGDADTALARIFDAGKVEREIRANAQIVQLFGLQASKAIGDYASTQLQRAGELRTQAVHIEDSDVRLRLIREADALDSLWGDHGSARLLAHAAVGGLSGGTDGALGATAGTLSAAQVGKALADANIDKGLADVLTTLAASTTGALIGDLPGTVAAFNEVSNNYLTHAEATRYADLQKLRLSLRCDARCDNELDALTAVSRQRDIALRACEDLQTPDCNAIRQQVRQSAAEFIRANETRTNDFIYWSEETDTRSLADDTLSGVNLAKLKGFASSIADGVTDLAKGVWTGFKALIGSRQARQDVVDGANATIEFLSDFDNLRSLVGMLTPAQREALATAYEQGDGKAVGRIIGEQIASIPIATGGLGTIKVTGKAIGTGKTTGKAAGEIAGELAERSPTHPDFIEHVISGDYNPKSRKVTGGHSLHNDNVRVVKVTSPPDANGVYEAIIEIKKPNGQWATKGKNTMFPTEWSREKIISEIDSAWKSKTMIDNSTKWRGESTSGVTIEGHTGPMPTAFPIHFTRKNK